MNNGESKRLDVLLFDRGLFTSREKARAAIAERAVLIDGKCIDKPAFQVYDDCNIEIVRNVNPYVGRGGLKLSKALSEFKINVKGVNAIDVGASTGGFTDCLLKEGASFVCACDVGNGQLDSTLRNDCRVLCLEDTDIRNLAVNPKHFGVNDLFDFACVDVSFISLSKILQPLKGLLKNNASAVCLIKPQFEAGKGNVGKRGIIKDPKIHNEVIENVKMYAKLAGFSIQGICESPIKGGEGNKEFLIHLTCLQ